MAPASSQAGMMAMHPLSPAKEQTRGTRTCACMGVCARVCMWRGCWVCVCASECARVCMWVCECWCVCLGGWVCACVHVVGVSLHVCMFMGMHVPNCDYVCACAHLCSLHMTS